MKKDPRYPTKHLSIRVPWHDNAWNGTVCNNPKSNGACLILKTCAQKKDDAKEQAMANTSLKDLDQQDFPPCITERGTVMADFKISRQITHPYVASSPSTHGHLKPTTITYPSFAAASIPYFWMRKENAIGKAEEFDLDYDQAREPEMEWQKSDEVGWVQEYGNQKALLNCFFQHLEEETSLVFLYAKQAPFVEVGGRVLMGVGRVKKIIPSEKYDGSNSRFAAAYWEHMVLHSVRSDCKDGFLIPYHDALKYQEQHSDFDISSIVVMAPSDKQFEFSYVSEHVSSDTAIRVLLDCIKSWETAKENGIGNYHNKAIQWIHDQVAELQKLRGEYPGMGSALCALGIERGHFVAAEIINTKKEADNPWTLFEKALTNPKGVLSSEIASLIPATSKAVYQKLKKENSPRIKFLHLLSRFDLTIHQATILYNSVDIKVDDYNTTKNFRSDYTDENFLENPYLIFEAAIHSQVPIALSTIDLGLYLKNAPTHLLPGGYHYTDALTPNRIRALTIQQLEIASGA